MATAVYPPAVTDRRAKAQSRACCVLARRGTRQHACLHRADRGHLIDQAGMADRGSWANSKSHTLHRSAEPKLPPHEVEFVTRMDGPVRLGARYQVVDADPEALSDAREVVPGCDDVGGWVTSVVEDDCSFRTTARAVVRIRRQGRLDCRAGCGRRRRSRNGNAVCRATGRSGRVTAWRGAAAGRDKQTDCQSRRAKLFSHVTTVLEPRRAERLRRSR